MKMFKKLMAVALVAVMALSMFTACGGLDSSDLKDAIEKKTKLDYDSSLNTTETYKYVDGKVDDIKSGADESEVKKEIKSAISKGEAKGGFDSTTMAYIYAIGGDEDALAADLKDELDAAAKKLADGYEYTTYTYIKHDKRAVGGENAVVLLIKATAKK